MAKHEESAGSNNLPSQFIKQVLNDTWPFRNETFLHMSTKTPSLFLIARGFGYFPPPG